MKLNSLDKSLQIIEILSRYPQPDESIRTHHKVRFSKKHCPSHSHYVSPL